jgi:two-component system NarL family response regulator
MCIVVATVESHRRNILRKLNLHSAADLTRYAMRHGLVAP